MGMCLVWRLEAWSRPASNMIGYLEIGPTAVGILTQSSNRSSEEANAYHTGTTQALDQIMAN